MKQPKYLLDDGVAVITHPKLEDTQGMLIHSSHLAARKPDSHGIIAGVVGGHGGDVYWVRHTDSEILAAYCFTEFELTEENRQDGKL